MGMFGSLFGGLNDGRQGMFSQLDGSNVLERLLMGATGSPTPSAGNAITMGALPPAMPAGGAPTAQPPRGLIGGMSAAQPPPAQAPAQPAEKFPWMRFLIGGPSAVDDYRQAQAERPAQEAERALKIELANRQRAALGIVDQLPNVSPEERIAAAFAPGKLGESFASGSERATLGRNDRSIFRGREVVRNDAPGDPQVVGAGGALVAPGGNVVYRAPQYQTVGTDSRLVETSPGVTGGGVAAPTQAPALSGDPSSVVAPLTQLGARMTSGVRTAEHNAQVGGVPNSRHVTGQAADLVPPQGMTMAQLEAETRARLPGARVINEGDHVHVQWGGGGQAAAPAGGPRVVVDAAPKPSSQVATPPGLTKVGANVYRDAVGRVYQPDAQGNMKQTYGVTDGAVSKATEEITGLNAMLAAATEYESAVKALKPTDFGPKGNYLGDPARFGRAQAAATNLMMLAKGPAMYNLGVLAGPDMDVLGGVIQNPSQWGALIRQGQILPKLHSFAAGIGTKYTMLANGFKAQGGDPEGLPGLYGAQRQNGRWVTTQRPAGDRPPLSSFRR